MKKQGELREGRQANNKLTTELAHCKQENFIGISFTYMREENHSNGHPFSNASCSLRHKSNSFVL